MMLATLVGVPLARHDDFDEWRDKARRLVQAGVPPHAVRWQPPGSVLDLFAETELPAPPDAARVVRASAAFVNVARAAALHRDEDRFDHMYCVLWRLQHEPQLMADRADADVAHINDLAKAVRRDSHKMHAFVRFREVEDGEGGARFVAWFEPDHHIVRANAGFFVRRFANMRWSILTPEVSLHWDGETLSEGPPAQRSDAPQGDPVEDIWRRYYASIFNPARLKVGAMMKEMPRKYWKNLPEAAEIAGLIAGAQAREAAMIDAGKALLAARPASLADIRSAIAACQRCPIGALDNRAVAGEGPWGGDPAFSGLMILGEQPGDEEDMAGRPFVGPAGQLLDRYLLEAGIERSRAYMTNAVKHFKHELRGKRRLHQTPTAGEIDHCRWWVESEVDLVQPRLILALGASAARSLLGRTVNISRERGQPRVLDNGATLLITAHPSYLLRIDGDAREEQARRFRNDLGLAVRLMAEMP